jgi:hypothetical protein
MKNDAVLQSQFLHALHRGIKQLAVAYQLQHRIRALGNLVKGLDQVGNALLVDEARSAR